MSRPVTIGGPRVTYRRNYFPSGRPDEGALYKVMMFRAGSHQARKCAVCGNVIERGEQHFVDRNGSIDRVHFDCAEAVFEVEPVALASPEART